MKLKTQYIILVAFIILAAAFLLLRKGSHSLLDSKPSLASANQGEQTTTSIEDAVVSENGSNSSAAVQNSAITTDEKTSLQKSTKVLADFSRHPNNLDDLLKLLKEQHQDPYLIEDRNAVTGEMIIVRTKNPPLGTRYFHAQYFTDQNNHRFVQHMSFEFRRGPDAFGEAVTAVQKTFPKLGTAKNQKDGFIQWDIENGYVVWIKKLEESDIENNPFNGYTKDDVGSIRVAIELAVDEDR